MKLVLAAVLVAAGATAAPSATDRVAWTAMPALSAAAIEAAGEGSQAEVSGDAGLGCFTTRSSVAASGASPASIARGFAGTLDGHAGEAQEVDADGRVRFVLGRYHGVARFAATEDRVEMNACMCVKDRYPLEDACASLLR